MRLAIVISHPVQYYSPWFRYLSANGFPDLRVFYLWNGGVTSQLDHGFGVEVKWDIPLLEGYEHEFVPNIAARPTSAHHRGLDNPSLENRLCHFNPDAILLFGYNYVTHHRLIFSGLAKSLPLLFRGDSHRLVKEYGVGATLRRLWIARIYKRFAAFLYVGQANRDYFQYHGVPDEKLFFCPHAVDNERFFSRQTAAAQAAAEWKSSLKIPAANCVVMFAGKFEEKKRPRDLIAAFKKAQLDRTTLLMVGNGEQEKMLRAEANGNPHIVFAPFQNQSDMPRTYAAGDVFVLPSGSETWGLAVNEAMCLERPVIVSDKVGCAADLVKNFENGLVFPAGNVNALAGALKHAFGNQKQLTAWGKAGRERIKSYDYHNAREGLIAALNSIAARR